MLRKQVTRPGRSQETRSTKSLVTGPIRVFVPHRPTCPKSPEGRRLEPCRLGQNLSRLGRYQTSPGRQSQLIGAVMSSLGVVRVRRTRT